MKLSSLNCIATYDSDYSCPLPRQRSEGSYRSLRRYTRQGLGAHAKDVYFTSRVTRQG